jgi:hypothetical protein
MAALAGCSLHLVQSIEIGRMKLSAKVANEISRRTGVSEAWLMENDPKAPMVAASGKPYSVEIFEGRQLKFHFSERAHLRWRQIQLGVGFDILHRLLRAAQSEGNVKALMDDFEEFITTKLKEYPALDDTIHGEHRRAREAAAKAGKVIPLGRLTPLGVESLKRGRVRLAQAIATVTASSSSKKRKM